MRHTSIFSILLLLSMSPIMSPASAAMFKWTDANGNVQYGQHPPADANAEYIKAAPEPTAAPANPSLQQQVEALDKRLAEEAKQKSEAEQKEQNTENRKINCENARNNLEQLHMGGHRLTRMPDGSYERLEEKQKQSLISKNKQAIKDYCD